ncbi:MAG: nif-specific transcriptional activator NifA [bacterium]
MPKTQDGFIKQLNSKKKQLTALYEISKQLASTIDFGSSINSSLKLLATYLDIQRIALFVFEPETKELVIKYAYGFTHEEKQKGRYKLGEGITGKVGKTGVPIVLPDVKDEPMFMGKTGKDWKKESLSYIAVPVKVDKKVVGVLGAQKLLTEDSSFEEDVNLLSMITTLIGQAMKLNSIIEKQREDMEYEKSALLKELKSKYRPENIIGISPGIEEVFDIIDRVSPTKATVLIRGESGTGKELVARAIHFHSPRAGKPFIKMNCAALPDTLLESELFGYEKGAFTGAYETKKGRFELAHEGTIFLDEIGELSLATQAKLLRVIQEKRFERLGSNRTIEVDVRIIAATNSDLEKAIKDRTFREDLYYRLNVVPIFLPPLRERKEDIPLLVEHFLMRFNKEHGKSLRLSAGAMEFMINYSWPGNIRELENMIERAVIMTRGNIIDIDDLPLPMVSKLSEETNISYSPQRQNNNVKLPNAIEEIEKTKIIEALKKTGGVKAKAARLLGITQRQLGYKIKKYRIEIEINASARDPEDVS